MIESSPPSSLLRLNLLYNRVLPIIQSLWSSCSSLSLGPLGTLHPPSEPPSWPLCSSFLARSGPLQHSHPSQPSQSSLCSQLVPIPSYSCFYHFDFDSHPHICKLAPNLTLVELNYQGYLSTAALASLLPRELDSFAIKVLNSCFGSSLLLFCVEPFSEFPRGSVMMFASVEGGVSCCMGRMRPLLCLTHLPPSLSLHLEDEEEEEELSRKT